MNKIMAVLFGYIIFVSIYCNGWNFKSSLTNTDASNLGQDDRDTSSLSSSILFKWNEFTNFTKMKEFSPQNVFNEVINFSSPVTSSQVWDNVNKLLGTVNNMSYPTLRLGTMKHPSTILQIVNNVTRTELIKLLKMESQLVGQGFQFVLIYYVDKSLANLTNQQKKEVEMLKSLLIESNVHVVSSVKFNELFRSPFEGWQQRMINQPIRSRVDYILCQWFIEQHDILSSMFKTNDMHKFLELSQNESILNRSWMNPKSYFWFIDNSMEWFGNIGKILSKINDFDDDFIGIGLNTSWIHSIIPLHRSSTGWIQLIQLTLLHMKYNHLSLKSPAGLNNGRRVTFEWNSTQSMHRNCMKYLELQMDPKQDLTNMEHLVQNVLGLKPDPNMEIRTIKSKNSSQVSVVPTKENTHLKIPLIYDQLQKEWQVVKIRDVFSFGYKNGYFAKDFYEAMDGHCSLDSKSNGKTKWDLFHQDERQFNLEQEELFVVNQAGRMYLGIE